MNSRPTPLVIALIAIGALAVVAVIIGSVLPAPKSGSTPQFAVDTASMREGGTGFFGLGSIGERAAMNQADMDMAAAPPGIGMPAPMPPVSPTAGPTAADVDQRIIKNGFLSLAVRSADEAVASLTGLAAGLGGFVQESSVHERADGSKYGSVTVRVPSDQFETALAEAKDLATLVRQETVTGQDVTEQYTDLQAQLRNAQAQEEEYLRILQRAQTVQDILSVQSYLGGVRSTIESLQGRLQFLENRTSFATLSVSLSEDARFQVPQRDFRPGEDARQAIQTLVVVAQSLVSGLILVVIVGGGVLLPLGLIIWGIVALVRRARSKRARR